MWANLAHGALMAVQAASELDRYWSKFFTDIPFVVILALGIYLWRRSDTSPQRSAVDHTAESEKREQRRAFDGCFNGHS
jgi:hypothetical protein